MLLCSPKHLLQDYNLWMSPDLSDYLVQTYQNVSQGGYYDCALTSVPCDSHIAKTVFKGDETLFFWSDVIFTYTVTGMLTVFGLFANIINIIIFASTSVASEGMNNLLLCLSISDLFMILTYLPKCVAFILCGIDVSLAITVYHISQIYADSSPFVFISLDIVTVIALQRAVAVVFPFHVSRIFSKTNVNVIIACVSIFNLSTALPGFASRKPRWVFHPYFNDYVVLGFTGFSDFMAMARFMFVYFYLHISLSLGLLLTATTVSLFRLKEHAKKRATLKNNKSDTTQLTSNEAKVTKLSLTVCIISFVILSSYFMIYVSVQTVAMSFNLQLVLSDIISVLTLSGNCYNIFVYICMSQSYKERLQKCVSFKK